MAKSPTSGISCRSNIYAKFVIAPRSLTCLAALSDVDAMTPKPCKRCGSEWHTLWKCPYRERPFVVLKTRKPMNKIGKVQKQTAAAVAKWKKNTPPNHQGYWVCYICGRWIDYLEAEHTKSKARHPELRTNAEYFRPVCDPCNSEKGSKDVDNSIDNNEVAA